MKFLLLFSLFLSIPLFSKNINSTMECFSCHGEYFVPDPEFEVSKTDLSRFNSATLYDRLLYIKKGVFYEQSLNLCQSKIQTYTDGELHKISLILPRVVKNRKTEALARMKKDQEARDKAFEAERLALEKKKAIKDKERAARKKRIAEAKAKAEKEALAKKAVLVAKKAAEAKKIALKKAEKEKAVKAKVAKEKAAKEKALKEKKKAAILFEREKQVASIKKHKKFFEKYFIKKAPKLRCIAKDFTANHWKKMFKEEGEGFIDFYSEKYPKYERYLNSNTFSKRLGSLEKFLIFYARDSSFKYKCK